MAEEPEQTGRAGEPPAGLAEPAPARARRPRAALVAVLVAVLLAVLACAGLYAGLTDVGWARADGPLLAESIELRSPDLTAAAVVVTTAGSTVAMAVLASLVGLLLVARGRTADAVLVVGAMAGAALLFRGLKMLLDRGRPPEFDRLVNETNESLPSGHATMSIVVIGSLVVLAWAGLGAASRLAVGAAAVLWVGAVGATRIYLGVHWFSDVVAGWLAGGAWLAVCVAAWATWRARHGARAPA